MVYKYVINVYTAYLPLSTAKVKIGGDKMECLSDREGVVNLNLCIA